MQIKQINLRLTQDEIDDIDAVRDLIPRSKWIRIAIQLGLSNKNLNIALLRKEALREFAKEDAVQ